MKSMYMNILNGTRVIAIVVDDTLYSRPRSKNVELLTRVHDHAGKGAKFKRRFRLLTLAWNFY